MTEERPRDISRSGTRIVGIIGGTCSYDMEYRANPKKVQFCNGLEEFLRDFERVDAGRLQCNDADPLQRCKYLRLLSDPFHDPALGLSNLYGLKMLLFLEEKEEIFRREWLPCPPSAENQQRALNQC